MVYYIISQIVTWNSFCHENYRIKDISILFYKSNSDAGGTIPSSLLVTTKKPDIVMVDQKSKSVNIIELRIPGESRLDTAHTIKMDSYSHFPTDIRTQTVTVTTF